MKRALILFGAVVLAGLVMQCNKRNVAADKAAVKHVVLNDNNWFNSSTTTDSTNDTTFVDLGNDTVLFWWRGVQTHTEPVVDVQIVGDSAYADWSRHNTGDLNILVKVPDTTWQLWVKKVFETARVRGIFRRVTSVDDSNRGWRLARISVAAGFSDSTHETRLDSMRIQSETNPNLLVVDPLNSFYPIDSLTRFTSGEQVTLTLYTNVTDGNAFLHTFIFFWPFYVRTRFNYVGNGVYTGTWNAQLVEFPRFAIFDVLDHRSLFAPTYPYDFSGWLFPYQIKNLD